MRLRAPAWLVTALVMACDGGDGAAADLPAGWEDARPLDDFLQLECGGSPYEGTHDERAAFAGRPGGVHVDYDDAVFRCAQDVEGFVLPGPGTLDLLVQPIDMHPSAVAGCDCLYHIELEVADVEAGDVAVTLSRRGDSLNEPNDPVSIATDTVTVP